MKCCGSQALRTITVLPLLITPSLNASAESDLDALSNQLAGTWTGRGYVDFDNGQRWGLRCPKMVWTRGSKPTKISSTIVCSTHPQQGYNMKLTATFTLSANGTLSGTWRESNYEVSGSHKGSFSSAGAKKYKVQGTLKGNGVSGNWSSNISGCALTMRVKPKNVVATLMESKFRKRGC